MYIIFNQKLNSSKYNIYLILYYLIIILKTWCNKEGYVLPPINANSYTIIEAYTVGTQVIVDFCSNKFKHFI